MELRDVSISYGGKVIGNAPNLTFSPNKSYPVHDGKGNVVGECTIDENGNVTAKILVDYLPPLNQQTRFSIG